MTTTTTNIRGWIGFLVFCIPLGLYLLWIYAFNHANGYPANVQLYNSYLPAFLKGRFDSTLLSLALCIVAVLLSRRNLHHSNPLMKIMAWFVVIGGCVLGFLNAFSML